MKPMILWILLFGFACFGLSLATWRVFRPKTTFYAAFHPAATVTPVVFIVGLFGLEVLTLLNLTPVGVLTVHPNDVVGLASGASLIFTYGRAVWHHIEHATRTPREIWSSFFGT